MGQAGCRNRKLSTGSAIRGLDSDRLAVDHSAANLVLWHHEFISNSPRGNDELIFEQARIELELHPPTKEEALREYALYLARSMLQPNSNYHALVSIRFTPLLRGPHSKPQDLGCAGRWPYSHSVLGSIQSGLRSSIELILDKLSRELQRHI
jgi:hypothetical protein